MDDITLRPDRYDDVLAIMHLGRWYSFTEMVDRTYNGVTVQEKIALPHVYENLVIHPVGGVTYDKPTKDYLDTELAKLQADFDAKDYARKRAGEYPPVVDQLDMIYHDQVNSTTTFRDAIKAVKDKYPKG